MKIALLHYSAPPVVGGVEHILGQQARLMAAAGHAVTVLAGRGGAQPAGIAFQLLPLLDSRQPRVLAIKAQLDQAQVTPAFHALSAEIEAELQRALAGQDVLIAHNVCSLHKNLALTAALARLNGQPRFPRLILWHHDFAWMAAHYRAELHAGYPWDLLRQAWPGARAVVISEARRQELAQLTGVDTGEIAVVPNGIDSQRLLGLSGETLALAAELGLEQAAPLLLLPVRLTPRKNIELALRALAALRQWPEMAGLSFEHAALLVTGPEGSHNPANAAYRLQLLALRDELGLAGSAHFAIEHRSAPLPDGVVAELYRLADALFLPSREEGFGIPVLEAGLARLPVFCSAIAPLQALGAGDVTYFSPDDDPGAIAALVARRLSQDATYRLAARVRVCYRWERIYADQIEPLLQERGGA
jgi:glycosyltransferase involved in cell wall biosynthesis